MRIMQKGMVKGSQIADAMMIIIVRHFRITKTGKISLALSFCPLDLLGFVERAIDHMDLTTGLKTGQTKMQYFLQRRKVFYRCGKHDHVESPVFEDAGTNIAMNEP